MPRYRVIAEFSVEAANESDAERQIATLCATATSSFPPAEIALAVVQLIPSDRHSSAPSPVS